MKKETLINKTPCSLCGVGFDGYDPEEIVFTPTALYHRECYDAKLDDEGILDDTQFTAVPHMVTMGNLISEYDQWGEDDFKTDYNLGYEFDFFKVLMSENDTTRKILEDVLNKKSDLIFEKIKEINPSVTFSRKDLERTMCFPQKIADQIAVYGTPENIEVKNKCIEILNTFIWNDVKVLFVGELMTPFRVIE